MRLKPIKWQKVYGTAKDGSTTRFKLRGEIDGILQGYVEAFYITNENQYATRGILKNIVYLNRSVPDGHGRHIHSLKFKTIAQAKKRAQEIGTKLLIDKYLIRDRKTTKKVFTEKHLTEKSL